jgi:hypothetical protein
LDVGERFAIYSPSGAMTNNPLAYSIEEAAKVSGIGRTSLYVEIAAGRLIARKAGAKRTIITEGDLRAYLASLPNALAAGSIKATTPAPNIRPGAA